MDIGNLWIAEKRDLGSLKLADGHERYRIYTRTLPDEIWGWVEGTARS